jgi:hypothetical protein
MTCPQLGSLNVINPRHQTTQPLQCLTFDRHNFSNMLNVEVGLSQLRIVC